MSAKEWVPPMWWLAEAPLTEGEEMNAVRDQFTLEPVGEQLVQMPQLGASRAYPDQPFCF
jgi:hypothetical protein